MFFRARLDLEPHFWGHCSLELVLDIVCKKLKFVWDRFCRKGTGMFFVVSFVPPRNQGRRGFRVHVVHGFLRGERARVVVIVLFSLEHV